MGAGAGRELGLGLGLELEGSWGRELGLDLELELGLDLGLELGKEGGGAGGGKSLILQPWASRIRFWAQNGLSRPGLNLEWLLGREFYTGSKTRKCRTRSRKPAIQSMFPIEDSH